jgi:hypothetical protein
MDAVIAKYQIRNVEPSIMRNESNLRLKQNHSEFNPMSTPLRIDNGF